MHRSSTVYKQKQSKTVLHKYVGWFWCERTSGDGLFHWRKRYYELWTCILIRSDGLKLKCLNEGFVSYKHSFFLHKMLTDGLDLCGLLVDYCDVLSAVWTLILTAPIHCRASIVSKWWNATFLQIWWRNKLINILKAWGWIPSQQIFHFWVNYSLTYRQLLKIPILQNIPFWLMTLHLWSECLLSC